MFDSKHIPGKKKKKHIENSLPDVPNQHIWSTVCAQSSAESLVYLPAWSAALPLGELLSCVPSCLCPLQLALQQEALLQRSPSRQAALNLHKEGTYTGSGGWWGESAVAHRCSVKEIRTFLLKDKVGLLAPVSLKSPWLAPLQRPFEASFCFQSPFYNWRWNFRDKAYASKIPLHVLWSLEMLVGFFWLNYTMKHIRPLLTSSVIAWFF